VRRNFAEDLGAIVNERSGQAMEVEAGRFGRLDRLLRKYRIPGTATSHGYRVGIFPRSRRLNGGMPVATTLFRWDGLNLVFFCEEAAPSRWENQDQAGGGNQELAQE
jgi:hypothetical protein